MSTFSYTIVLISETADIYYNKHGQNLICYSHNRQIFIQIYFLTKKI